MKPLIIINNFFNKGRIMAMVGILAGLFTFGQQNNGKIWSALRDYTEKSVPEKIFVHTDKKIYLAGEIIWFKLYVVDGENNKPIDLSKVGYIEVLDRDNKPLLQGKVTLEKGTGNGSLYVPVTTASGVYKLRAYTNWMKNLHADCFFEEPITLVNSLKSVKSPTTRRDFDVQFFPEGGDLVQGIQSEVGFRIANQAGDGLDCHGILIKNDNDTVLRFEPFKFGIGRFSFTPEANSAYRAVIDLGDTVIARPLPRPREQGYVLKLSPQGSQLVATVTTNIRTAGIVYLFAHTRQQPKLERQGVLVNGVAQFEIDKKQLGDGVSQITVFTSDYLPVCERLFFIRPAQKLVIQPSLTSQEFGIRKKVGIVVTTTDEGNRPSSANLSISVYRTDSLHAAHTSTLANCLWLTSDLRGRVANPDYYFENSGPDTDEATDNLMLIHGWRRFTWPDLLPRQISSQQYVPEYKGHIVTGKVVNIKTGLPEPNIVVYLSVPGPRVQLYDSRSDSTGLVRFYTKEFNGPNEVVLQTDRKDSMYRVQLTSPFDGNSSQDSLPVFSLSDGLRNLVTDYNISMQVQNGFIADKLKKFYAPEVDSTAFFGNPDVRYKLDNYARYSTMEEVLREYVYEVLVRRQKENFHFIVSDVDNKIFLEDPLTLINSVPVFDPNIIIKYDPLKVQRIDIVKRKYFYGPSIFNGIVNFITYQPDPSILSNSTSSVSEYEGLQYQREFYSPVYESTDSISQRIPDFRNVLYWGPDIQTDARGKAEVSLFTSDLKGQYIVVMEGISADGRAGEGFLHLEVK